MNTPAELDRQPLNTINPGGDLSTSAMVLDSHSMDSMMRLAEIMATGRCTIPVEYRNSPGDCLAVVMQSMQWKMNPFAVAQKTHFVQGKIGYEAQLVNAVITSLAPTKDRIHYEWFGPWEKVIGKFDITKSDKGEYRTPGWKLADEEGIGIRVWATMKGEDEPRVLELLLAQARTRNSTMWADDPRQQLAYLATKRWARLYCPDVILGVYSPDELDQQATPAEKDVTPASGTPSSSRPTGRADTLKQKLGVKSSVGPSQEFTAAMQAIAGASCGADIRAAKDLAKKIVDANEIAEAMRAYTAKFEALRKQASQQQADQEVKTSESIDNLIAEVGRAETDDQLDILLDRGNVLPDDERAVLADAVKNRREGL